MRDKLIDIINSLLKEQFDYVPLEKTISIADKLIENDVIPVVHGHWSRETKTIVGSKKWKCSACGKIRKSKEKYCPDCGAKMDKE